MFDVSFWELLLVFIGFVFVPPELSKSMLKNALTAYRSLKDELATIKTEVSKITTDEDLSDNHDSTPDLCLLNEASNEDKSYAAIEKEAYYKTCNQQTPRGDA